jgi:hypothetical protein
MSDLEGSPTLPIALNRIAIGINFGSIVIAIMFSVWGLAVHGSGPLVGVTLFELIALGAVSFIGCAILHTPSTVDGSPSDPPDDN